MPSKKSKLQNLALTDRDRRVLYFVFTHRYATARHIQQAIQEDWDFTNLRGRLKRLTDHRYLDRPPAQKGEFVPGGGKTPIVYALGIEGQKELSDGPLQIPVERVNFTHLNNKAKRPHIKHTLMTTEFLVSVRVACKRYDLIFYDESDLIQTISKPGRVLVRKKTRGWTVPANPSLDLEEKHIIPDRMFAIEYPHLPPGQNRRYFFLESDTGSETQRGIIANKLKCYRSTAKQRILQDHFPAIKSFIVLVVTKSPSRSLNMLKESQNIANGWRNFLFTDVTACTDASTGEPRQLFDVVWRNGKDGGPVQLKDIIESDLQSAPDREG